MKKILIFFCLITASHLISQTNAEETILIYNIAQGEYEAGNYSKAIEYLKKVDAMSPEAKTKTSYLNAICLDKLNPAQNDLSLTYGCLGYIDFYMKNGKDSNKKMDLMKIKLNIQDNSNYKDNETLKKSNYELAKNLESKIKSTPSCETCYNDYFYTAEKYIQYSYDSAKIKEFNNQINQYKESNEYKMISINKNLKSIENLLFDKCHNFYLKGNYSQAKTEWDYFITKYPNNQIALYNRALCKLKLNDKSACDDLKGCTSESLLSDASNLIRINCN